jgi:hypothetical protein
MSFSFEDPQQEDRMRRFILLSIALVGAFASSTHSSPGSVF